MTNREKYINNASDEELANLLYDKHKLCDKMNCDNYRQFQEINEMACNMGECRKKIKGWLSQEAELTADEMFEEMGYKKEIGYRELSDMIVYYKNVGNDRYDRIIIESNGHYSKRTQKGYGWTNSQDVVRGNSISPNEDKAIHKKIEELKNGR